jgi:hypothetical protein
LLTYGPRCAKTAVHMCVRYHYNVVTEGARHPVTSATHVAHDAYDVPHEKACPLRTVAIIKWSSSLQNKDNLPRNRSQRLEEPTL